MKILKSFLTLLAAAGLILTISNCGGGSKEPLIVMRNPATSEKTYFYKVEKHRAPHEYNEAKHIQEWKAQEAERGFTEVVKEETR